MPSTLMTPRRTGVVAAGALLVWPFVEPHLYTLRRVSVPVLPPGEASLRILHVSDLHLLPRQQHKAAWLRALARLEPDLVVSTGDHWSSVDALDLLVELYAGLTSRGAVGVFVPGNNDYFAPVRPEPAGYLRPRLGTQRRGSPLPWHEAASELTAVGWLDLTSRRTTVELAGQPVTLTGTDDAHLRRDRYVEAAGPTSGLAIGVTHTPARRLLDAFGTDGHALVLAGHTHGGQLRVPGVGAVVTNCDLPRWRARGLTRDERGWLHVSAGLGCSPYLPVRTACRPEASLVELVSAGGSAPVR